MKYFDIQLQRKIINDDINKSIKKVLRHGKFILGPETKELEEKLSNNCKSKYVVTCSSGTDAILMSLMALNIKSGDEIITPAFTWMSNSEMINLIGAKPIYVDICEKTFNINLNEIQKKITRKTKAILAISLFGQTAELIQLKKIAKKNNIYLIEDAAQSYGAKHYKKKSCSIADISTTSFFPTKPLAGYGDGGACFTNNKKIYKKLIMLRNHGQIKKGENIILGLNARLDTLQASIILEKLKIFENEIKLRNEVASFYNSCLKKIKQIQIPFVHKYNTSVYAQYSILSKNRKQLLKHLKKKKIPFMIFYPKPIYKQKAYYNKKLHLPITEKVCNQIFSIPFNPYIKKKEQHRVISAINEFFNRN